MRALIYKEAENHFAFCQDHEKAISYDGNSLKVKVFFERKEHAMSFATSLRNWNYDRPLHIITEPTVSDTTAVATPPNLMCVLLKQYDPKFLGEDGSPIQSLADLQGSGVSSAALSAVSLDDDLSKYQSIEKPQLLRYAGNKTYKLHLKNQGKKFGHDKSLKNNPNNMLAGTWNFHQHFDGLNREGKMPTVAINAGEEKEEVQARGHKRRKVMLDIEFLNDQIEFGVSVFLKDGSEKVQGETLKWRSFVHVRDVKTFKDCMGWKYEDTKKQWADAEKLLEGVDEAATFSEGEEAKGEAQE